MLRETRFFFTLPELADCMAAVESTLALHYALCTRSQIARITDWQIWRSVPTGLEGECSSSISLPTFLAAFREVAINARAIHSQEGTFFVIDQLHNPDSIALTPSQFSSDRIMLCGRLATVSDTERSRAVFAAIDGALRSAGKRVRGTLVSPVVASRAHSGTRLTWNVSQPQSHDLHVPSHFS